MTLPPDIDVPTVLAHVDAKRRGVFRTIRNYALFFLAALLLGTVLGLLIPGDDPNWSAPHVTYTRIGEAP